MSVDLSPLMNLALEMFVFSHFLVALQHLRGKRPPEEKNATSTVAAISRDKKVVIE